MFFSILNVVTLPEQEEEEDTMMYITLQDTLSLVRFLGGEFFLFLFMVLGLFYLNHVAHQACVRHNAGQTHSASVCRYR
jgi:hypothetical protein